MATSREEVAEASGALDRAAKILSAIHRDMRILELGPSYSPIAPRSDGWNSTTVDHASREKLVAKYEEMPGADVSRIEDVDVLWTEGPLDAAVPADLHGSFDACIASHVLEHIPDPIGLLKSLERLLTPEGVVSLAVPDKRFCFDCFKPRSSVGDLLEAHERRAVRHSLKTRYDMQAYSVRNAGETAWGQRMLDDVTFLVPFDLARQEVAEMRAGKRDAYVDSHAWYFTPSSFALAILELAALGELDFNVFRSYPTEAFEFHVTLRRGAERLEPEALEARRLALLHATVLEAGELTAFLPAPHEQGGDRRALERQLREGVTAAVATARHRVRARTRLRSALRPAARRARGLRQRASVAARAVSGDSNTAAAGLRRLLPIDMERLRGVDLHLYGRLSMQAPPPHGLRPIPGQISEREGRLLYDLTAHMWDGKGNVLELGTLFGASTQWLGLGMASNARRRGRLVAADAFAPYFTAAETTAQLEPLLGRRPDWPDIAADFEQAGFRRAFEALHGEGEPYSDFLTIRRCLCPDTPEQSHVELEELAQASSPIGLLVVDSVKSWYTVRAFAVAVLQHVQPGSLIAWQDQRWFNSFGISFLNERLGSSLELLAVADGMHVYRCPERLDAHSVERLMPPFVADVDTADLRAMFHDIASRSYRDNDASGVLNATLQLAFALASQGHVEEGRTLLEAARTMPGFGSHGDLFGHAEREFEELSAARR